MGFIIWNSKLKIYGNPKVSIDGGKHIDMRVCFIISLSNDYDKKGKDRFRLWNHHGSASRKLLSEEQIPASLFM